VCVCVCVCALSRAAGWTLVARCTPCCLSVVELTEREHCASELRFIRYVWSGTRAPLAPACALMEAGALLASLSQSLHAGGRPGLPAPVLHPHGQRVAHVRQDVRRADHARGARGEAGEQLALRGHAPRRSTQARRVRRRRLQPRLHSPRPPSPPSIESVTPSGAQRRQSCANRDD
jgi:hypothetical protein